MKSERGPRVTSDMGLRIAIGLWAVALFLAVAWLLHPATRSALTQEDQDNIDAIGAMLRE